MKEMMVRILVGGGIVTGFSLLGSILKPKSFAGLFGAAPSVALATLILTVNKDGKMFATTEAKSMILGAIAFILYAFVASWLMIKHRTSAFTTTGILMILWFASAFGLYYAVAT